MSSIPCSQQLTEDLILNKIKIYQGRTGDRVVAFLTVLTLIGMLSSYLSSKNLM